MIRKFKKIDLNAFKTFSFNICNFYFDSCCDIFNKDFILEIKIFLFLFENCNKVKLFFQALKRKLQVITEINCILHN